MQKPDASLDASPRTNPTVVTLPALLGSGGEAAHATTLQTRISEMGDDDHSRRQPVERVHTEGTRDLIHSRSVGRLRSVANATHFSHRPGNRGYNIHNRIMVNQAIDSTTGAAISYQGAQGGRE